MANYAYLRVSTSGKGQDTSRQKSDTQAAIKGLFKEKITKYFKEEVSGAKLNRKEYQAMLDTVKSGDTIIATEVSRLSRSTKQFLELVELVQEQQLRLIVGSLVIDCRNGENLDPTTKATLSLMAVFAELERDMTRERIKSGLEQAKKNGKQLGRPHLEIENIPKAVVKEFELGTSNMRIHKLTGLSRTTVIKYRKLWENQK